MSAKKIIVAFLIIIVAIGGFVSGLYLLRERQEIREKAAVPGGQAEVSVTPATGNYSVGDAISTSVFFNPANIAISGVAVRLIYPFSGTAPEIAVSNISVNEALFSGGDWTCPTQNSVQQGENVVIDIACANTSASGFVANANTLLAIVTLEVTRAPVSSPLVVRFDPALSVITRKSDNQDILLVPTSTGSYTIAGAGITPTPQVTITTTPALTTTTTPSPTTTLTPTPTAKVAAKPTATTSGQLPVAGVSYPTIFGFGLGILVVVVSLILAL